MIQFDMMTMILITIIALVLLEFIACNEICNNKSCRLGTQITISCNLVEKHCGRHMKFYKEMQLIHVPILCVLKCTCKPRFTKIEIKCIKIRRQPIQKLQITTKPQDEAKKFNESPPLVAVTNSARTINSIVNAGSGRYYTDLCANTDEICPKFMVKREVARMQLWCAYICEFL
ncbi:unnamed protein product [Dracunculus medinensis]|uniref:Nodule Cysteine-Rich (NCR) secreted peptide n=1 Tax=Dracunculus medinensis TaxID=318479 RepID=A0A0N4UDG6_DRAME|nr:unnamed protein product [Dracunculus medinensis]